MSEVKAIDVLAVIIDESDASDSPISIRGYLCNLLKELWNKGEGFSGKRPFGNSGWEFELHAALVKAGYVEGSIDEDGCVEDVDEDKANALIFEAIEQLRIG